MSQADVEFAPAPLPGRRRPLPPLAIGLAVIALIAVALVKPWGSAPPATHPPATAGVPADARTSGGPASPAPVGASAGPDVIEPMGPPPLGTWGVATASGRSPTANGSGSAWSGWTVLAASLPGPAALQGNPLAADAGCTGVPTIDAEAAVLALTVPPRAGTEFDVLGWWATGGVSRSLDGYLRRLDTPGSGPTAEITRTDGWPWPDGRYEFLVQEQDHVTALGFCLVAPVQSGPEAGLDPGLESAIVAELASRSGVWGVGNGGVGPRLVRDEPWTDWAPVEPGPAWNGGSLTLWPDTGLCMSVPRLLSHPSVVAITVPAGPTTDLAMTAWWQDGSGIRTLAGLTRQVAAPERQGVAYFERIDRAPWPVGRYEFDIQAGGRQVSLTSCIG